MKDLPKLEDFPARTFDKLRYGDTDRQGHVNNAVFVTFFETGRVDMLDKTSALRRSETHHVVLARLSINYVAEVFWPGKVEIGSGVTAIGTSSVTYAQAVFQNGKCVAFGETVVVQVSKETGNRRRWTRKRALISAIWRCRASCHCRLDHAPVRDAGLREHIPLGRVAQALIEGQSLGLRIQHERRIGA